MSIHIKMNLSGLENLASESEHKKRQAEVAERAAFMMRKYVPTDGVDTLRDSEKDNSDYDHGKLIWNTPYAAKHYYVPMNHTTAGTTDHWDIEMMNKEGGDLLEYVKKMYTQGK